MSSKKIGDPLEQVATTGKIGGRGNLTTQKSELSDGQSAGSPTTQTSGLLEVQNASTLTTQNVGSSKVQNTKGGRVQQTVYLPPNLAKWVKIQAIEENREISEITADALEMYRQSR